MAAFGERWRVIPGPGKLVLIGLACAGLGILLFLLPDLIRGIPIEVQITLRHPLFWLALAIPPACLGAERFAGLVPLRCAAWAARAWPRLGSSAVGTVVG